MNSQSMTSRLLRVSCAISATGLLLAGCTQYNGALGSGARHDRIRAQAIETGSEEALQPRPQTTQTSAAATSTGRTSADAMQAAEVRGTAAASSQATSNAAATSDAPTSHDLRLFGRLPGGGDSQAGQIDNADNIRRVTFATEGADFDPQIDPTGRYLVYSSTQHRKTADIYIKRVDGTAVTQLTNDPADDMMPVFSPDGSRIAFCSNRSGNWDIYIMDLTGGQPVQITNDPSDDFHPSFSPDGRRLVYCTFSARSGQWELVVVDLENVGPKRFIGHGLFPSWSPVEDRILFQRARERGTRWFSIWTMDIVNNEGVRPTEIMASANAAAITPRWSPDGKHIVFCTVVDPEASLSKSPSQADIWVITAEGRGRTNLTKSRFANLQPVWAKDGTIYFSSNRGPGGVENIWSLRPDRALEVARDVAGNGDATAGPLKVTPQNRSSAGVKTDH